MCVDLIGYNHNDITFNHPFYDTEREECPNWQSIQMEISNPLHSWWWLRWVCLLLDTCWTLFWLLQLAPVCCCHTLKFQWWQKYHVLHYDHSFTPQIWMQRAASTRPLKCIGWSPVLTSSLTRERRPTLSLKRGEGTACSFLVFKLNFNGCLSIRVSFLGVCFLFTLCFIYGHINRAFLV